MQSSEIWVENRTTICVFTFPRVVHWPRHVIRPMCPNKYTHSRLVVCIAVRPICPNKYTQSRPVVCIAVRPICEAMRGGRERTRQAWRLLLHLWQVSYSYSRFMQSIFWYYTPSIFMQLVDNSLQIKVLGKHSTPRSDLSTMFSFLIGRALKSTQLTRVCLFSFTSENLTSLPLASDVCGCSSSFFCHELLLSAFLNHSLNSRQEGDKKWR